MQGFEAAQEIAAAIRTLDQSGRVDEIIVARGGGSREDLWVFNAEEIARAALSLQNAADQCHWTRDRLHDSGLCSRPACAHAVRSAELAVPDREEQARIFENIEENIHKIMQKRLALCYNESGADNTTFCWSKARR